MSTEFSYVSRFVNDVLSRGVRINGRSKAVVAVRELKIQGCGIADIVFVPKSELPKFRLNNELLKSIASSQGFASFLLSFGPSSSIEPNLASQGLGLALSSTRNYISLASKFPPSEIKRHLAALQALDLWAVEAKLRDWRRALRQSSKHQLYCSRSALLMPPKVSESALAYLTEGKAFGVGFWSFDPISLDFETRRSTRVTQTSLPVYRIQSAAAFLLRIRIEKSLKG